MSSAAKFYDGARQVRAIGILRFSPGRLIPLNSTGREGKGQLQSLRFYKFDNEAVGRVFLFNRERKILEFRETPDYGGVSPKSRARRRGKMGFVDGILI